MPLISILYIVYFNNIIDIQEKQIPTVIFVYKKYTLAKESANNRHKTRQVDKVVQLGELMCPLKLPIFFRQLLTQLSFTTRC